MLYEWAEGLQKANNEGVLILVLLEDALRAIKRETYSYIEEIVLILVLLEDALRANNEGKAAKYVLES